MPDIQNILEYAVWAPSGDNSQPWEFVIDEYVLHIFNLPDRDNPFLNYEQSGSYIAHGALIENIMIAASHFGYETQVSLFPEDSQPNLVATISFILATSIAEDTLFKHIRERHTNRKPYVNKKLTKEQLGVLVSSVQSPVSLYLVEDNDLKKELGAAGSAAEIVILENKQLHHYLFADVVWSTAQERLQHHGLYIDSMEFNFIQKLLFRFASFWPLMRIAIVLGLPRFIAKQDAELYSSGAAMGLITLIDTSRHSAVLAGRAMQRIWLSATSLGLSFHPVSATLFFGRRVMCGEASILSSQHKQIMQQAYSIIKKVFSISENDVPYMMFRIGEALPSSARTSRYEVATKIKKV